MEVIGGLFLLVAFLVTMFSGVTGIPYNPPSYSVPPSKYKAVCRDGTYSYSRGRGTCSHHGGVAYYL